MSPARARRIDSGRSLRVRSPTEPAVFLFVAELLPAHAGFVHQPALGEREDRHAVLVGAGHFGGVATDIPAGAGAAGRRLRRHACGHRHRGDLRTELEFTAGKLVECTLVLEEDDLAEGLAAQLRTDSDLRHRGISDIGPLFVHAALAVRTADDSPGFADGGKHRVAIGVAEERAALAGLAERLDGVGVGVGMRRGQAKCQQQRCQLGEQSGEHHVRLLRSVQTACR